MQVGVLLVMAVWRQLDVLQVLTHVPYAHERLHLVK